MQNSLRPLAARCGRKFEHDAAVIRGTKRRAIQIPCRIEDQVTGGIPSIFATGKRMKSRLRPGAVRARRQLEDGAVKVSAPRVCCAVQISGTVKDHAGLGLIPFGAVRAKAV